MNYATSLLVYLILALGSGVFWGSGMCASASRGIYALTPIGKPISNAVLHHAQVTGIVVRVAWRDIEPTKDQYRWEHLDEQVRRVERSGKLLSLVVVMGGRYIPAWVMEGVGSTMNFVDEVKYHREYGSNITVPSFWDAFFVVRKRSLIKTLGLRYGAKKSLSVFSVQCANASTDDWYFPEGVVVTPSLLNGFNAIDRLSRACKSQIDEAANAFPHALIKTTIGRVPKSFTKYPTSLSDELVKYGDDVYPGRLVLQRHNLSATTPSAYANRRNALWRCLFDYKGLVAAQFLWPASDILTCRLAGGQKPCNAVDMFSRTVNTALEYKFYYVEVYAADLENPSLESEVTRLFTRLSSARQQDQTSSSGLIGVLEVVSQGQARETMTSTEQYAADGYKREFNGSRILHKNVGFTSSILGREYIFTVSLPSGYYDANMSYPVIYWLHGKGGNPVASAHMARYLQDAVDTGIAQDAIMVFPDGGKASFYTDAYDGAWPVESIIINELVPFIDSKYRVKSGREGRWLHGFSMGGFGALKFIAKYPALFSGAVAYGAPRLVHDMGLRGNDLSVFTQTFGSSEEMFRMNTPGYQFRVNRDSFADFPIKIRLVAGERDGTRHSMSALHNVLESLNIDHDYLILPGVAHVPSEYYRGDNGRGFSMIVAP